MPADRLLIVSAWYPNRVYPNDGNFVRQLAELVADDYSVTLVTTSADYQQAPGTLEVERTQEGKIDVLRGYYSGAGTRVQRIWARRNAWKRVTGQLSGHYDLIHAHVLIDGGIVASRLARKWSIPFVVTAHASRWLRPWPRTRLPERYLAKRAARAAHALMPVSEALRSGLEAAGIRANFQVVPNVVEDQLFTPPSDWRTAEPFTFLHVSDFSPNKRLDLLIPAFLEVWDQHPNCTLRIAGDGDLDRLQQLVAHYADGIENVPIRLSGPHERAEIAELMRGADAFVLPSDYETQSVVVLEAQLSGLPVIATRCGGPEGILRAAEQGTLIPVGNQQALLEALAEAVREGRKSPAERQRIAALAAKRFGTAVVKARLLAIYQSARHA